MKIKKNSFIIGFVLGSMIFGSLSALAAGGVMATASQQKLYIDGKQVAATVYNIDGSNYFKLRDIGQALNMAIDYDATKNAIMMDTKKPYGIELQESQQHMETTQANDRLANKSVAPQFNAAHRPLSIATNTGDIIYGTGNDKTINPQAIGDWDGCFEITGDGKPLEPALGSYDPNWQGYQDIEWPDPIPAYSNTKSVWDDGRCLFVFNAHETQRLIDALYRTLYATPECFTDGRLNCKVMIGMTENSFESNHFYPYRDSEVSKQVIGGKVVFCVYAVDVYQNGMYDCTKYMVKENGWYNYKTGEVELWDELLDSKTAVMSYRQDKK